jgi:general secretion pathway protein D
VSYLGVDGARFVLRVVLVALGIVSVAACTSGFLEQRDDEAQTASDVVRSADLQPRNPKTLRNEDAHDPQPKAFSFFGATLTLGSAPQPAPPKADAKDGFTLDFENSPVADVAKVVLGDILGASYVIDPRAQGSISLSSGRPIAKKDVLFVLESALRANNLVMVRDGAGYRIVPANDGSVGALDRTDGSNGAEPGFGMTAIPLQYVSAPTLAHLLEGFATRPGAVRADPSGNMILIIGNGSERQSALDTVRSFDVDWMRGQSVGLYPVKNSAPEPIVAELEKIMDSGESGLNQNLVKFQVVGRQNAILVVSSKPQLLQTAAIWISRLDSPANGSTAVRVYRVRYGDAKQIAQLLKELFLNASGASSLDSAANQIAPSSGATTLTAAQRLSSGGLTGPSGANTGTSGAANTTGTARNGAVGPFGASPNAATAALAAAMTGGDANTMAGVRITADAVNNSILIYANQENYALIERALNQIDRPKLQVAIDVTIAEVTLNDALNYGVQFYLSNSYGSLINSASGQPTPSADAPPGFNLFAGNSATPHVILNALHSLTDVKILSNPSLVVVENQTATLEVGDQVPTATGSATVLSASNTIVNTVDYKNTGIILKVQPHVSINDNVLLDIEQEISSVPLASATLTPTISERKVKSSISVASGQLVLLAGLISETATKSRAGIPLLDQLPYIGNLATTGVGKSLARTELIILIRPQVIHNGADAAMVAEELRSKMRGGKISAVSLPAAATVLTREVK